MSENKIRKAIIDSVEIVNTPEGRVLEISGRANSKEAAAELPLVMQKMGFGKPIEVPTNGRKSFSMADLGDRYDQIFRKNQAPNN